MIKEYTLPDSIDSYIMNGIRKGRRVKRAKAISRITGIAAAAVIILFLGAIRVSPVFAAYASEIPGLEYIVKLISDDKGLLSAVDNKFIQRVDKSEEAENIVFTVKDIIADDANLIVFYSIENKGGYKWPSVNNVKLMDENGKNLEVSSSYGMSPTEDKIIEGKITFSIIKEEGKPALVLPDNIILSTRISCYKEETGQQPLQVNGSVFDQQNNDTFVLDHEFRIPITVDKTIFESSEKLYTLNRTIDIESQKITFNNISIYPTRLEVDLSFARENTMEIFAFEDLKVIDEKGREWGTIMNGISATYPGDKHRILYFQSNYFTSPKKLYLKGSSLRALDKSKLQVRVDLEGKRFMETPDDKLTLTDIKRENNMIAFFYSLKYNDKNRSYNIFSFNAADSNGNKLESKSSGVSSIDSKEIQEGNMVFEFSSQLKGPVTLNIQDYPNYITKPFRIDIIN